MKEMISVYQVRLTVVISVREYSIIAEEVWHLDCDRAKRSGPAIASSLPPQEKHIKTRPSSENFPRNGQLIHNLGVWFTTVHNLIHMYTI